MNGSSDWRWKLAEAIERIRTRYEHIGRKTGAPFLAVVYPPEAERAVLREWHTLTPTLQPDYDVRPLDVLQVTADVVRNLGLDVVVGSLRNPMPGSDPTIELGSLWTSAVVAAARHAASNRGSGRVVVALERLAALFPASGPRAVMQALWDSEHTIQEGPIVILVPGVLLEARVYSFVGQVEEFMYRGDIL
jgi:hypothetical protein